MKSLFVKNLPYDLTPDEFKEAFEEFGEITGVNIATEWRYGRKRSRGYGFVDFKDAQSLTKCLESGDTITLKGREVEFREARDRPRLTDQVFVSGLVSTVTDASLMEHFRKHKCTPKEVKIVRPQSGDRLGFGYAMFEDEAGRDKAIEIMNGTMLETKPLVVREASRPFRNDEEQREYYRSSRGRWNE
jgi:RNA recognition motif-containing protein